MMERGTKVRVKAGLGTISLSEGYIVKVNGDKALVNFPYYDIKEIYLEDLEEVGK